MKTPKPPFRIYTIYQGWEENPVLASILITRVTRTKWWFEKRAGLEFHCRTGCTPHVEWASLNPREAWEQYRQEALDARDEALTRINAADIALAIL